MSAGDRARVLVAGAGIVGRSVAYYLSRSGVSVVVADRDPSPSATTRASLGVLTRPTGGQDPLSSFYRDAHSLHERLSEQLRAETGLDAGWRPLGGLDLALDGGEAEALRSRLEENRSRGVRGEWLDEGQLREAEPALSEAVAGAAFYPGDQRVDPPTLASVLQRAAEGRGARFRFGVAVGGLRPAPGGVECDLHEGGGSRRATFDAAVIAAGSWSADVGGPEAGRLRVRPVRGQSCLFAGGPVRHVLRCSGGHVLPAPGGLLVGGTVEETGFDARTTPAAGQELSALCGRVLARPPVLRQQRAGLRPKPPRGRPLIGPVAGAEGLWAATGHYRNGVLMGPLTGRVLARWITTGDPGREMSPFGVDR